MPVGSSTAGGISRGDLARAVRLPTEDLPRALTATGQVQVVKVNGQMTYRTTM
jgi:hypothetical protein